MKSSTYLVRNRFGTLYFRVAIPRKFQRLSDDIPKEVRISMRTHLKRDAAIKARTLWVYFQEAFEQMGTLKTSDEGAEYLNKILAEEKAKALLTKAQRKQSDNKSYWMKLKS